MNRILSKKQSDYLLEFSCIPSEMRQRFLNRLYFRKNGSEQKNYKLLSIIQRIIEKDNFKKWDEGKICKELKVSKAMLACMKSRLLKSMREEYFSFKSNANVNKMPVKKSLEIIKGLEEKGCYREVIPMCFRLIKIISIELKSENDRNKKSDLIETLSELYYIISQFYFYNKNVKKFKTIYSELERIKKKVNGLKNKNHADKILSRYYVAKSQLFLFKQGNNKYLQMSLQYKLKSLLHSEKAKDYLLVIRNLIHLARIYRLLGEYDNAAKIIRKGQRFSKIIKNEDMFSLFEVLNIELDFNRDKSAAKKYYASCINLHKRLNSESSFECVQTVNFKLILITSFLDKEDEIRFYEKEYVRSLALRGKKYEAFERKFWQNAEWQRWNLYRWKIENEKGVEHYSVEPDAKVLSEVSEQIIDYTRRNYKIYNSSRMLFNYLFRIVVEYWKGKDSDYETILYFLNKVNRLLKSTKVSLPRHNYLNIKFLVTLLNESKYKDKKETYLKYAKDFDEVLVSLKSTTFNVIEEYAKIEFASKLLNLKMFTDEVRKLEKWLRENRPQLFEPINDLIFKKAV